MTTSITPSLGHAVGFTQQGVGTTPGYDAIDLRRAGTAALQEGVMGGTDYMVVQRGAGANLSVDIGAGSGAQAFVQGDSVSLQGIYAVPTHSSATINEAITTANVSNPRIDQIVIRVKDNVHDSLGANLAQTEVLTGTATAGATLANRTGAAALPANCLLLADVLVGASATSVTNANIRDRRKWARGAHVKVALTSGNVSTASATMVAIAAALTARVECSGAPLLVRLMAYAFNGLAGCGVATGLTIDGSLVDSVTGQGIMVSSGNNLLGNAGFSHETIPAAGSHVFQPTYQAYIGNTANIQATAGSPTHLVIDEIVRQNLVNNSVTTG